MWSPVVMELTERRHDKYGRCLLLLWPLRTISVHVPGELNMQGSRLSQNRPPSTCRHYSLASNLLD